MSTHKRPFYRSQNKECLNHDRLHDNEYFKDYIKKFDEMSQTLFLSHFNETIMDNTSFFLIENGTNNIARCVHYLQKT